MSDLLDITGASGARYRFRRASLDSLPATAGNFVAVTGAPAKPRFLVCGAAASLGRAAPAVAEAIGSAGDVALFVRLNVSRTVREAEHADIVAAVAAEVAFPDLE